MPGRPWRVEADGLRLSVRLTPRGGRDAIDGIEALADGRLVLACRVRAAPTEGQANAALLGLIAKTLGLRQRDITFIAGESARLKTLHLAGAPGPLAAALEAQLDQR
jgi:uncharacterized protein